jgi:hypothetical protein
MICLYGNTPRRCSTSGHGGDDAVRADRVVERRPTDAETPSRVLLVPARRAQGLDDGIAFRPLHRGEQAAPGPAAVGLRKVADYDVADLTRLGGLPHAAPLGQELGTGIPTKPNLHEVAQEIAPDVRVVYTDNDPIVLAHARALMHGSPEGRTAYIDANMRDPQGILNAPELRETLDLDQPIGLMIIAMTHFIEDDEEAFRVVQEVVDILPSGSYFASTIATDEFNPGPLAKVREQYYAHGETLRWRTREQALRFFDGLELVDPGLVQMHLWRPNEMDIGRLPAKEDIAMYGGVARVP